MNKFIATCICVVIFFGCKDSTEKASQIANSKKDTAYSCIPCGYNCDTAKYNAAGTCSSCKMELVKKENILHHNILIDSLCFLNASNTIFLDVRTEEEFKGVVPDKFGVIKNAINIPVQELEKRRNELDKFKNKNIVVYCSHAHRSAIASYQLTQNGFSHVHNLLGGMSVWKEKMKTNPCISSFYINQ